MAVQLCSATLLGQPSEGEHTHLLPSCLPCCAGFVWTGFGSEGQDAIEVESLRICQKSTKPMPARSKMNPLFDKAEPKRDDGDVSVITCLGRKKCIAQR